MGVYLVANKDTKDVLYRGFNRLSAEDIVEQVHGHQNIAFMQFCLNKEDPSCCDVYEDLYLDGELEAFGRKVTHECSLDEAVSFELELLEWSCGDLGMYEHFDELDK